jgi:acetone carboxylase gamma subunit
MTDMDSERIKRLIEGDLSEEELRNDVLPDPKDPNRFEKVRETLQARVDWEEPILVPLNDHLHVVAADDGRIVKGECGHEFGPVSENWKTNSQVRVREDQDEINELYPKYMGTAPNWTFQLREFFCPECYELIDVDAVPAGYPVLHSFEPDIDAFYEEWLGESPPDTRGSETQQQTEP